MELEDEIQRQRIKHIVSSYQLAGAAVGFGDDLAQLLADYPPSLIELAMVETLVEHWLMIPRLRGRLFLQDTRDRLRGWEATALANRSLPKETAFGKFPSNEVYSSITPEQFKQITGLDPSPIFGSSGLPPAQSPSRPLV